MFPIILSARYTGCYAYRYKKLFLANKPEGLRWYSFTTVILSPTDVVFIVYDMKDTVFGGLGEVIDTIAVNKVDTALTRDDIEAEARRLAIRRREAEIEASEVALIERYMQEELSKITVP